MSTISENRIAQERLRIGIDKLRLARELDVSISKISSWESGRVQVPSKVMSGMASIFNCSIEYLFGDAKFRSSNSKFSMGKSSTKPKIS